MARTAEDQLIEAALNPGDGRPSVEEVEAARQAAASTAATNYQLTADQIAVYDPEHEALVFGPGSSADDGLIRFGPRGGFEPNVWVGPRDHPLLQPMMARHPKMFEIGAANKVYVCDYCGAEYKALPAIRGHKNAKHGGVVKDHGINT
jgi:uncharacterized Zn-finger protein